MKLYELTDEFRRIQELAEDQSFDPETGEYVEPSEQMKALLDDTEGAIEAKIEGIVKITRSMAASISAMKAEEARIAKRRKSMEGHVSWLKAYGRDAMVASGKEKFRTNLFTIYIQTSAPPVLLSEGATFEEQYLRPEKPRETNKEAIKKALRDGKSVPGARLGEGTKSLVSR